MWGYAATGFETFEGFGWADPRRAATEVLEPGIARPAAMTAEAARRVSPERIAGVGWSCVVDPCILVGSLRSEERADTRGSRSPWMAFRAAQLGPTFAHGP